MISTPSAINVIFLAIFLGLLVAPNHATAGEKLLISGAEGGDGTSYNYYAFAAAVVPIIGSNLGNGFVQRYWVDFLGYSYQRSNREIDATAMGLEGALGYQHSWARGWGAAYLGVRYSNTWLSPDVPDSKVRGGQVRPKTQVEGEIEPIQAWKINGIASYVFGTSSYWLRGRLLYRLHGGKFTGPEAITHGDPDYKAWQFGWLVTGFEPVPKSNLGIKAGVRITERLGSDGYLGIEMTKPF